MKSKYHNKAVPERIGTARNVFKTSKDDPEALELLAKRNFDAEKMALGFSYYEEASKEFNSQQESISEKTETKDEKMDKLDEFMYELIAVSKIIEESVPNFMKRIGLIL